MFAATASTDRRPGSRGGGRLTTCRGSTGCWAIGAAATPARPASAWPRVGLRRTTGWTTAAARTRRAGRTARNFLSHSLRRCKEAYVFSNEGDLALRLASTAANYFSFPAKTRFSGYKLGNLTAKRFTNKYDESNKLLTKQEYGIINLQEGKIHSPYQYLEIRASNLEHRNLCELEFGKVCEPITYLTDEERLDQKDIRVSDLFTYFDCTDYIDVKNGSELADLQNSTKLVGIVSYALKKSDLNFPDYFRLGFAYFIDSGAKNINTHGGYFDGNFSQKAIYEIAFLGFKGFLISYLSNSQLQLRDHTQFEQISREQREKILDALSKDCQSKGIQVVLSPKCYQETVGT